MRKFEIYHRVKSSFTEKFEPPLDGNYQLVALVQANDVEHAFELTNHRSEESWTKSPSVLNAPDEARSTSVGDVVHDLFVNQYWLCGFNSWILITGPQLWEGSEDYVETDGRP